MSLILTTSPVSAGQEEEMARVEEYLSGISTIVADFSQVSTDGSLSKGKFFLKRPGKMRWQYSPPNPIVIVSDGKTVTYYDAELDQVSYIGVDDTLAGFLAQKDIKLDGKTTKMTNFESGPGVIRVTMVQRKKPDDGELTLEFSDKPLELRKMMVKDATGHVATVQLQNAKYGQALADKLFLFEDPRGNARRQQQ